MLPAMRTPSCVLSLLVAAALAILPRAACAKETWQHYEKMLSLDTTADLNFYNLYRKAPDMERKMQYAEIFISKIDTSSRNPVVAGICDTLAQYYEKTKYIFSRAIVLTEQALKIYETSGDRHAQAECQYRLARLHYRAGEYHKTLLCTNRALELFRKTSDELRILDCYNLLGMVYHICKDYSLAKSYFAQYVDGVREHNDSSRFIYALNNAAVLENALRDSVKTRKLIEESLDVCRKLRDTVNMSQVCLNSAGICMNIGLYEDAERYLEMAGELVGDDIEKNASLCYHRGVYAYIEGRYADAIEHFTEAIGYYSLGEFDMKKRECWLRLQRLYEMTGQIDSAYACLKRSGDLEARINIDDMYLELFRAQNSIVLSAEKDSMYRARVRNGIIFILILTASVVAGAITVVIYKKKRNQVLLREADLKSKKAMFEIKDMQKFQMDRLVEDIVGKLVRLSSETSEASVRNRLREICSDLRQSRKEDQWKEISNYIPDSESEFLSKLVKDFPDLSTNERRLCVLLNKNLSTKEISEITRQSTKSINVARTRLRSKLGLTGSDALIQDVLSKYN